MPEKRKNWNDLISGFRASDLVFLDESGCNTDMTRRYAYSLGGSRAVDSTPLSKPKNTTILSSIQLDGTLHDTTVFLRKMSCATQKSLAAGHIMSFQIHPKQTACKTSA